MFGQGSGAVAGSPLLVKTKILGWLLGLLAAVWLLPNTAEIMGSHVRRPGTKVDVVAEPPPWLRWQLNQRWATLAGLLLAGSILGLSTTGEFLYYNF